jgi:hypothetical protein
MFHEIPPEQNERIIVPSGPIEEYQFDSKKLMVDDLGQHSKTTQPFVSPRADLKVINS